MNCEGPYLEEGFLHNLCPCFDIVFAQLGVITRTRNKFVEILATPERYLVINSRIKEAAVPNMPSRKISWWKNVNKKGKIFYLIYSIVSLSKMAGKIESFLGKISWIWTCSQVSRKFSYWENLLLFWIMLYEASAHLYTLGNNTRKNSPTNIYLFIVNNRNTRKRWEVCSKLTIMAPHQNDILLSLFLTLNIYPTFF